MIRTEDRSVLYLYTKFQALFIQKLHYFVQKLQNFEIWSRDPDHTHLWVVYGTEAGRVRPPSLYLKRTGQFVHKL